MNEDEHHKMMNNIWENFIMTRNKCDLEVHKENKKSSSSSSSSTQKSVEKDKDRDKDKDKEKEKEKDIHLTPNSSIKLKQHKKSMDDYMATNGTKVRFRECSDKAREKNLTRCLLGRFRGFAEGILFTILSNRTLVILANNVQQNKEKVMKTVRALSLLIPGVENTNSTQEWRDEPLFCHQLPNLKIVGMSSETCHKSPDNIWDLITIIQFDDSILYGPPYKCKDENKSFVYRMLHPRKRFKNSDLFYRYLSRIMLEMSLHVFLFYYISQTTINIDKNDTNNNHSYYVALLETLQFTQSSDIDIAKHWCTIIQKQLYSLSNPPNNKQIKMDDNKDKDKKKKKKNKDDMNEGNNNNNDIRRQLLAKYGQRIPPVVRIT